MTAHGNPPRRAMVLAPQAAAVRQARTLVKEACQAAGTHQVTCDAAVLLTSETVTNAFVHGRSEARLEVAAGRESVHVEVGDDNSRHPTRQPRDEDALDGRGLEIVRMLAARWGVRDEPFGKVVWFEVTTDHVDRA